MIYHCLILHKLIISIYMKNDLILLKFMGDMGLVQKAHRLSKQLATCRLLASFDRKIIIKLKGLRFVFIFIFITIL